MSERLTTFQLYQRAFLLAVATGGRTGVPIAAVMHRLAADGVAPDSHWLLKLLADRRAASLFGLGALAELFLDKLPTTPSRLRVPTIFIRLFWGGAVAATVLAAAGKPWLPGALLGPVVALAGAAAGYCYRIGAVKATGLPDIVPALGEDAVTIGASLWAVYSEPG